MIVQENGKSLLFGLIRLYGGVRENGGQEGRRFVYKIRERGAYIQMEFKYKWSAPPKYTSNSLVPKYSRWDAKFTTGPIEMIRSDIYQIVVGTFNTHIYSHKTVS